MLNPILKQLNNPMLNNIIQAKKMLEGKNPNIILEEMLKSNPQFKAFYDENKDKTAEQIANAYGLDFNEIKALL